MVTNIVLTELLSISRIFFVFFITPPFVSYLPAVTISREINTRLLSGPLIIQSCQAKWVNWEMGFVLTWSENFNLFPFSCKVQLQSQREHKTEAEAGKKEHWQPHAVAGNKKQSLICTHSSCRKLTGRQPICSTRSHGILLLQPWILSPMLTVNSTFYCPSSFRWLPPLSFSYLLRFSAHKNPGIVTMGSEPSEQSS